LSHWPHHHTRMFLCTLSTLCLTSNGIMQSIDSIVTRCADNAGWLHAWGPNTSVLCCLFQPSHFGANYAIKTSESVIVIISVRKIGGWSHCTVSFTLVQSWLKGAYMSSHISVPAVLHDHSNTSYTPATPFLCHAGSKL
jgi:hypothetical protein